MNTRQAEKARTRQRYLSEAARLFSQRGFHGVSIDAIGEAVGVSGPALYRHFASKEAMLTEILQGASERLLAGFQAIRSEPHNTGADLLLRLIDFHLDFALSSREVIRLQDRELATLPEESNREIRRMQREYLDSWAELVSQVRPEMALASSRVLMHAVFGILNSTAHNESLAPEHHTRVVLTEAARRALLPRDLL